MLKTENSSQLFDVTLFCRNGHPKRKVEKSECKNENGSNPNPEFSFFTLMGGYLFCQCFPYYDVTLIAVRREKSLRFLGGFSLFCTSFFFFNRSFYLIEPHIFYHKWKAFYFCTNSLELLHLERVKNWCR